MEQLYKEFKNISLTGRLCYLFMCIEKYLVICYPDRDWTPVAKKCWQWTNQYWDAGSDIYDQVVPEFLLEFDDYRETNERVYDGALGLEEYLLLKKLFHGITCGDGKNEIDEILMLPVEFNNVCEGSDFHYADAPTLLILNKMMMHLEANNIIFPDIDKIKNMTIKQREGWGDLIDSEFLSIIL